MNLIIGAGAVGTVLAGYFVTARQPLSLLVRKEELSDFAGLEHLTVTRIHGGAPLQTPCPKVSTTLSLTGVKRVFICVKYPDLKGVLDQFPEELPNGVELFPCINGPAIGRIFRERFPGTAVTPLIVKFNALLRGPMDAQITLQPRLELLGSDNATLQWFNDCGFEASSTDEANVWGRLITNLGHPVSALTGAGFKQRLIDKDLRHCLLLCMSEAIAVLDRAGIDYKLPYSGDWRVFEALLKRSGTAAWLVARHSGVSASAKPSMVADIDLGRPTEIEQINGEIVRIAAQVRMSAPVNQQLVTLIHAAELDPIKITPPQLREQLEAALGR